MPTLQRLGMRQAFVSSADFTGLGHGTMAVDQVAQRVYLHVDEKGTTASAATGVSVAQSASVRSVPMRFDHPFLFVIRDTTTGAILFASEINKPTAG